jgi:hypothetical protein
MDVNNILDRVTFFLSTPGDAPTSHDFVGKEEGENFYSLL